MKLFSSISLVALLAFQVFLKVGIIGYYGMNKGYIIANFCENISKPEMHCDGKCYLKKQLEKADESQRQQVPSQKETTEILPYIIITHQSIASPASVTVELRNLPEPYTSDYTSCIFHPPSA